MKTIDTHISIFVALYATPTCLAFVAPPFGKKAVQRLALSEASTSRTRSAIYAKASNDKHSDNQGARTCVKNFLTQRSFQSFIFLLKEMHDPHTNHWIEEFLSSNNLLSYHGSGAFDLEEFPFWDSPFTELIKKDADVVHVELKAKGQDRKSRNKNDAESKPKAGMWTGKDFLSNISTGTTSPNDNDDSPTELSGPGVKSYADMMGWGPVEKYSPPPPKIPFLGNDYLNNLKAPEVVASKTPEKDSDPSIHEEVLKDEAVEKSRFIDIDIDIDPPSLANRILSVRSKISREWVSDLKLIIVINKQIIPSYNARKKEARTSEESKIKDKTPSQEFNPEQDRDIKSIEPGAKSTSGFNFGQRSVQSFERGAVYMVNNHPSFNDPGSTPLRSSNFDLLFLLSTQEAIHRLLNSYKDEGEEKRVSYSWLKKFYVESLDTYFDGNQSFGRADDFIDDLLICPPALKTIGGKLGFIDPLAIAEDIIDFRGIVAKEWQGAMKNVSEDHESISKQIFVRQMSNWGQPISKITKGQEKSDALDASASEVSNSIIFEGGEFE